MQPEWRGWCLASCSCPSLTRPCPFEMAVVGHEVHVTFSLLYFANTAPTNYCTLQNPHAHLYFWLMPQRQFYSCPFLPLFHTRIFSLMLSIDIFGLGTSGSSQAFGVTNVLEKIVYPELYSLDMLIILCLSLKICPRNKKSQVLDLAMIQLIWSP